MPYIHRGCDGEIGMFSRKCKKCGKQWPISALFAPAPPPDMVFYLKPVEVKRGKTSYAKWADRFPGAGALASRFPNWPRWARIMLASIIVLLAIALVLKLTGKI